MSYSHHDYDEKRNFIRMKIDTPANITVHAEHLDLQGICRDLSGGGMLVEVAQALPEGTEALITITSTHGHSPVLKAATRVARSTRGPGDGWTLGLEILSIQE